jgi:two-component system, OmpR family, KDP operon response regulator KdpE
VTGVMSGPRILVVDDEPAIRRLIETALSAHGFSVLAEASGQDAVRSVQSARPDLVILDLGLPDLSGVDVVRYLREWTQTPIIILSVREDESDKIEALEAGADDYVTKPFGMGELLARVRSALRRAGRQQEEGPVFTAGRLTVDMPQHKVRLDEADVQLTPTEYGLLKAFVSHAGKVLTHRQLIREVWGGSHFGDALHVLRVNVSNLRHKLERDPAHPDLILTEPGVGYRLRTDPSAPEGTGAEQAGTAHS